MKFCAFNAGQTIFANGINIWFYDVSIPKVPKKVR